MKKRSKFFYAMIIMSVAFVLIIGVLYFLLWCFLSEYQKSVPTSAAQQYIKEIQAGNYENAMEIAGVDSSKMSVDQYKEIVKQALGNGTEEINTYLLPQEDESQPAIEVKSGDLNGIIFDLKEKTGDLKFNLKSYTLTQRLSEPKTYTIIANDKIDVLVNNIPAKQLCEPTTEAVVGFEGVKEQELVPKKLVYKIENMYIPPKVEAQNVEFSYDNESLTYTAKKENKNINDDIYTTVAIQTAKEYAKFISGDAKLSDLSKYLYTESDFYKSLKSYSSYWYIDHNSVDFKDMKTDNIVKYSDNAFSIEVRFEYLVYLYSQPNVYPTAYKITFLKKDRDFKATSIQPID